MRILLISTELTMRGGIDLAVVASLDEGAQRIEDVDAVIVDVRDSEAVQAELERASKLFEPLPIIAIVRGATEGAGVERVRLVDENWLDADGEVLVELARRDVDAAARQQEARQLRDRHQQLVHNEKFAAVGLLAAEIAHEINNPATFVITNLTVMMDYVEAIGTFHDQLRGSLSTGGEIGLGDFEELAERHEIQFLGEDLTTLLQRSLTGLNRIHQIVRDLRYFGADQARSSNWVDIDSLVHAALGLVRHEAKFRAELHVELPRLPVVKSDANGLSQVILNLLVNAVQSIQAGAPQENRVVVSAEVGEQHVVMSVTDTGSGIPPEELGKIFEPFFTTKEPGDGTGLGLAISRDIMRSLGGEIEATSAVGIGSTFRVIIPIGADDE